MSVPVTLLFLQYVYIGGRCGLRDGVRAKLAPLARDRVMRCPSRLLEHELANMLEIE
jgi:hypothetical protein